MRIIDTDQRLFLNKMTEIEQNLNYLFKNKELLKEALTHPSMSFNQKNRFNNQRLEFLGDAILSTVITEYLFLHFPQETEGLLSNKKHFLVSGETLVKVANKTNLGKFLILTKGEETTAGRKNLNNLENAMEAIIGAIYLDSNFDIIKNIILILWKDILEDDLQNKNPKTELQEWTQKYLQVLPIYKIEKMEIINKLETFTLRLEVENLAELIKTGHNIKEIEKELAKEMLEIIQKKAFKK